MKISAFTFAKNVRRFNYPFRECILSALPLVDEFVVNVGLPDTDGTLDLVRSIDDPKIRIVESHWNPNVNTGGYVLAQQTNIALFNCTGEWAIYLQADELLHEKDYGALKDAMIRYRCEDRVEGLSLKRLHFIGDLYTRMSDLIAEDWVCRVVKPHRFVLSRGDAASFTVQPRYKEKGRRIRVARVDAAVYHYGWAVQNHCAALRAEMIDELWSGRKPAPDAPQAAAATTRRLDPPQDVVMGDRGPGGLYEHLPRRFVQPFEGSHPAVMAEWIARHPPEVDLAAPAWRTDLRPAERRLLRKMRLRAALPTPLKRYFSRQDCVFTEW